MMFRKLVITAAIVLVTTNGAALAADGAALFKTHCAKCHGDTGHADSPAAKAMKAPALASNATIAGMSDADLVKKVKENKKHAMLKSVSDDELAAVATHVKGLAVAK